MGLSQSDVAPQHGAAEGAESLQHAGAGGRARGPHPLPLFLAHATRACAGDRERLARILAGLRRYQEAPPAPARALRAVVAQTGNVTLRGHGGAGRDHGSAGPVVVVVPSLINPPSVLDLAPGNSLLDGLAARGLQVFSVDWGVTEPLGLAELVEDRLVPLLAGLGAPVSLAGYCLGGTLAVAAAALLGDRVRRLALLATPWHFGGYEAAARAAMADWWAGAGPLATGLGALPMELLQPAFWELDSAALAAKYERFADLPDGPAADAFVTLEDWSNTGQPLSLAAARGLAEDLFRDDRPGRGAWCVGGAGVDAAALRLPILDIIAGRDRIVPPGAALSMCGIGTALPLDAGHVGMVVGGRAPQILWDPLARWLRE